MSESQEQFVDQKLAKYDLSGDENAFRVIMLAAVRERDFERFYRHAGKLVGDEKMRRQLDAFANDEAMHLQEIEDVYEEIKGFQKLPDTVEELIEACPWESSVVTAGMPPEELFDMAIKLEKDAQLYYEARMEGTTNTEVLELLEYLSVVEEEQYVRLKAMRDGLH